MKYIFFVLVLVITSDIYCQKVDSVNVPKGVTYNYCKPLTIKNAELIIRKELSDKLNYELLDPILFVGPVLWSRFSEINTLSKIEGGNTTLLVDDKKLSAKLTQNLSDSKKIWDQLRIEVGNGPIDIRKANYKELQYFWSVISFDIDEPLLIVEMPKHRYILNISNETLKLLWLDEAP